MDRAIEKQFEELRAKNKVRHLTEQEDGTGIERLPSGVYGFTYSPAEENFPIFQKKAIRSFEAHKLLDGTITLLGFVSEGDSLRMQAGRESVTVHLHPEPKDEANRLVVVPLDRVLGHRQHSQREGKGLEIQIGPVG